MQKQKQVHKKSAFLLKTYEILENTLYQDIITWHFDGVGFVIGDIDRFTSDVLPVYFKHSNFASFIRQLNMYGFSKKRSVKSENYYYHAKFQRNQKDLIKQIQRKMQKKTQKNTSQPNLQQHTEQIRISSQLSIQLQYKPQPSPKPQPSQPQQKQTQIKYQSLVTANNTLINIQFSSILQILQDLKELKYSSHQVHNRDEIQNILIEYIQTQYYFYNALEEKVLQKQNYMEEERIRAGGQVKENSAGLLETQEILKDKKDNEYDRRA